MNRRGKVRLIDGRKPSEFIAAAIEILLPLVRFKGEEREMIINTGSFALVGAAQIDAGD